MKTGFLGLGCMGSTMAARLVKSGAHCARWATAALGSGLVALMLLHGAHADNFSKAYYDSHADQLVVSMIYRGTNPKHAFTLQCGQC